MEPCAICKAEFPHATPNPARYDAKIRTLGGVWGYLCETHVSHAYFAACYRLDSKEHAK